MSRVGEQKQHIQDIASARYITGTLRDIAAIDLSGLMTRFENNDLFYSELRDLYRLVWRISAQKNSGEKKVNQEKTVFVAYTTNRHFYGSINHDIMRKFSDSTGTEDDCIVIGDTGKTLWQSRPKKRKRLAYVSFNDEIPTNVEIEDFLAQVQVYERAYIFYPKFVSVFEQRAEMVDINFAVDKEKADEDVEVSQFLLEPEIDEMMAFFYTQVRRALFERILLETQLSRVSARLVKMDTADQNAEALLKIEGHVLRRVRTSISSRQMLETLVGYIQWHNKNKQPIAQ